VALLVGVKIAYWHKLISSDNACDCEAIRHEASAISYQLAMIAVGQQTNGQVSNWPTDVAD